MSLRGKERRRANLEETFEPDLLPMMNICLMLILAMLTMAAFVPMAFISSELPKMAGGAGDGSDKKPLNLTIWINASGFEIHTYGQPAYAIPRQSEGDRQVYNFQSLTEKLADIKKAHPQEFQVVVGAQPNTIYDDIVHTMDASRQTTDGKPLFPVVIFTAGESR